MSKYQKLDALILNAIGDVPKKFVTINTGMVKAESERISREEATPRTRGDVIAWRMVDRRLQALRKAVKIRSTSTGWVRV